MRILKVSDVLRLRAELIREGWRITDDHDALVSHDGRTVITSTGFYACFGLEDQEIPSDDIDVLEPVFCARVSVGHTPTDDELRMMIANAAFDRYLSDLPDGMGDARPSDVMRCERESIEVESAAWELRRYDDDPGRWDALVNRYRTRLMVMRQSVRPYHDRTLRMLQLLASLAVVADVGQFILALSTASSVWRSAALVACGVLTVIGLTVIYIWQPD